MATYIGNGILVVPPSEVSRSPKGKRTPQSHVQNYSTTAQLHRRHRASIELMVNALQAAVNHYEHPRVRPLVADITPVGSH
jgi:hypothetical protein